MTSDNRVNNFAKFNIGEYDVEKLLKAGRRPVVALSVVHPFSPRDTSVRIPTSWKLYLVATTYGRIHGPATRILLFIQYANNDETKDQLFLLIIVLIRAKRKHSR